MKKWIMTAVIAVGFSGFAAAQTTPAKTVHKSPAKENLKKGEVVKSTKKAEVKKDSTIVKLPMPVFPPDTLRIPEGKKEQNY